MNDDQPDGKIEAIERLRGIAMALSEEVERQRRRAEWSQTILIIGVLGEVLWFILQIRKP